MKKNLVINIGTKIGILVACAMAVSLIVQVFYVIPQIRDRELVLQKAIYEAKVIPIANEIEEFQNDMVYKVEMLTRMPEIKGMNSRQQELLREFAKTENKSVFPKASGFVERLKKYFGGN